MVRVRAASASSMAPRGPSEPMGPAEPIGSSHCRGPWGRRRSRDRRCPELHRGPKRRGPWGMASAAHGVGRPSLLGLPGSSWSPQPMVSVCWCRTRLVVANNHALREGEGRVEDSGRLLCKMCGSPPPDVFFSAAKLLALRQFCWPLGPPYPPFFPLPPLRLYASRLAATQREWVRLRDRPITPVSFSLCLVPLRRDTGVCCRSWLSATMLKFAAQHLVAPHRAWRVFGARAGVAAEHRRSSQF